MTEPTLPAWKQSLIDAESHYELREDLHRDYGITIEHLPDLIEFAGRLNDQPADETLRYGPWEACRVIGSLGIAGEDTAMAIEPLLQCAVDAAVHDPDGEDGGEFHLEHLPRVFATFGAAAIEPLLRVFDQYPELLLIAQFVGCTATRLKDQIGDRNDDFITVFHQRLDRCIENHQSIAGDQPAVSGESPVAESATDCAGTLYSLDARQAAGSIEKAFSLNLIDPMLCGPWGEYRKHLGVSSIGHSMPTRIAKWPSEIQRDRIRQWHREMEDPATPLGMSSSERSKRRKQLKKRKKR